MGRVFSWSQIASQRVPSLDDIRAVVAQTRTEIQRSRPMAAIHFGSTLPARVAGFTRRSDVEFVVIAPHDRYDEFTCKSRSMVKLAWDDNVPLAIYLIPITRAGTELHGIGYGLYRNLVRSEVLGGRIQGVRSPTEYLNMNGKSARDDLLNYVDHKLRYFGSARLSSLQGGEYFKWLQKLLENPVHLVRKVLESLGVVMVDDSRQFVIELAQQTGDDQLTSALSRVVEVDRLYNAWLESYFGGEKGRDPSLPPIDEGGYREMLNQIEELSSGVEAMFDLVAVKLHRGNI